MPTTKMTSVGKLRLDLRNYRTVPQKSETRAVNAIIAINPDWFWALTESLLDDGYLPTENVIVVKSAGKLIVREGNRRVAALKIIHGTLPSSKFDLPQELATRIANIDAVWIAENKKIPCSIYAESESETVDRIVTLTHGKGEKAGRDKWNAVAKARHNRDHNGDPEPALDCLERYLKNGNNLTDAQRDRWSGLFPLTVLEEALKRIAPRLGFSSAKALALAYPTKISHRSAVEDMIRDIGLELLGFEQIRDKQQDFAATKYKLPPAPALPTPQVTTASKTAPTPVKPVAPVPSPFTSGSRVPPASNRSAANAVSVNNPQGVMRAIKGMSFKGAHRNKLVTLQKEILNLKLERNPLAFCFLLRSLFELSAKAYCDDHSSTVGAPKYKKATGDDRTLIDVLRDVTQHLTKSGTDRAVQKELHGAITEMAKSEGLLSVTSMNQLVHNPKFSITASDIAAVFNNVFPLLEHMNR